MAENKSITHLFDKVDISDVIGGFLLLAPHGDQQIGLCPFDTSGKRSLRVYSNRGVFKCFECGRGGNAVDFLIEHEHFSYEEALNFLAAKYNVPLEISSNTTLFSTEESLFGREASPISKMIQASEWVQNYFRKELQEGEEGKSVALPYIKQRGIGAEWIERFGIGYSPKGKAIVTEAAIEDGISITSLEESGVTIKREEWIRDRFASRITFPIHNLAGRVIAFGARTMSEDKKVAKYINSPESPIYHKSNILYGISQAIETIKEKKLCYIVEGYTDVISMHMAGVENVVASAGTALTIEQIRLIRRFTDTVCMIYDGDAAGVGASMRGIELILKEGMNVYIIPLPESEDPDSFSRSLSREELKKYMTDNRVNFIHFISSLRFKESKRDPIKRAQAISDIVRLISLIPYQHIRVANIKECSTLLKLDESNLYQELSRFQRLHTESNIKKQQREMGKLSLLSTELHLSEEENPFRLEEYAILHYLLRYGTKEFTLIRTPEEVEEEIERQRLKAEEEKIEQKVEAEAEVEVEVEVEENTKEETSAEAEAEVEENTKEETSGEAEAEVEENTKEETSGEVEEALEDVMTEISSEEITIEPKTVVKVSNYILDELNREDIISAEPAVQKILDEYKVRQGNFTFEPMRYFSKSYDKDVSRLCSEILSDEHTESGFWTKKGGYVQKADTILDIIIPKIVAEYKLKKVKLLSIQFNDEMKNMDIKEEFDKITRNLEKLYNLNLMRADFSKRLGNRTVDHIK